MADTRVENFQVYGDHVFGVPPKQSVCGDPCVLRELPAVKAVLTPHFHSEPHTSEAFLCTHPHVSVPKQPLHDFPGQLSMGEEVASSVF